MLFVWIAIVTKSLNCQARSAAIFVSLVRAGLIDEVRDYASYMKLFRTQANGKAAGPQAYECVQILFFEKPDGEVVITNASTNAIRKAQRAFEGAADSMGIKNEDDVQALIDEVRYGKGQ